MAATTVRFSRWQMARLAYIEGRARGLAPWWALRLAVACWRPVEVEVRCGP